MEVRKRGWAGYTSFLECFPEIFDSPSSSSAEGTSVLDVTFVLSREESHHGLVCARGSWRGGGDLRQLCLHHRSEMLLEVVLGTRRKPLLSKGWVAWSKVLERGQPSREQVRSSRALPTTSSARPEVPMSINQNPHHRHQDHPALSHGCLLVGSLQQVPPQSP